MVRGHHLIQASLLGDNKGRARRSMSQVCLLQHLVQPLMPKAVNIKSALVLRFRISPDSDPLFRNIESTIETSQSLLNTKASYSLQINMFSPTILQTYDAILSEQEQRQQRRSKVKSLRITLIDHVFHSSDAGLESPPSRSNSGHWFLHSASSSPGLAIKQMHPRFPHIFQRCKGT